MSTAVIFDDIFEVRDIDPDGKKFDKGTYCSRQFFVNLA